MKNIKIFDTTLRDGEQSPGASLNIAEKIQIALALEKMGVDIIEAGFAIASQDDFKAINKIAGKIKKSTVCSLARAKKEDIEAAYQAIKPARKKRIHTFLATSDVHLKYKLKMTKTQALRQIEKMVKLAKDKVDDVEFSPEDGFRTEPKFLFKAVEVAILAGATTVNIPDTVGYATPREFGELIADICKNVPNIKNVVISAHCHNDLGMATANSLAAVKNGAGQIECTVNGLGERAGNAALEEVVMALKTRKDYFKSVTNIKTKEIATVSKLVSNLTSISVQPNKAIVGANAFAHEAGIHQHGVLSKKETYEIMEAEDIGLKSNELVLGKHSGKHGLAYRLKNLGITLDKKQMKEVFERFKELADRKKKIYDEDLLALISDQLKTEEQKYSLELLQVVCGNKTKPMAMVGLKDSKGKNEEISVIANGPIDAVYRAIDRITKNKAELLEFSIKAITSGKDAQAEVFTKIRKNKRIYSGYGASNDIILASAKSYLNALNNSL
ncbi:MAG: 2-isopropylmalate synthase [Candidatus Pacebacteria bacterium]|nr:2-isopropylmalate synthase [Candidatus Paceibacterota bacterium]